MFAKVTLACLLSLPLAGTALAQRCRPVERVWVPPRYEIRHRELIIPAVYEIVYERVWIEPAYEWRVRRVYVPARQDHNHLSIKAGRVGVRLRLPGRTRPGYYRTIREQVLVRPGHWSTIEREILVEPERAQVVREKVLVHEGHWTTARIAPAEGKRRHKRRISRS